MLSGILEQLKRKEVIQNTDVYSLIWILYNLNNDQLKAFESKEFWSQFSQKLKTEEKYVSLRDLLKVYDLMLKSKSDQQSCQSVRQMTLLRLQKRTTEHGNLEVLIAGLALRQQLLNSQGNNQQTDNELGNELLNLIHASSSQLSKSLNLLRSPEALQKSFLEIALREPDEKAFKFLEPLVKQLKNMVLSHTIKNQKTINAEHFDKLNDHITRKEILESLISHGKTSKSEDLSLWFERPL